MLDYSILPANLQGGMKRYIEDGIEPGSFLRYCLENDFVGALGKAGPPLEMSIGDYLMQVASFLWNELPCRSSNQSPWGSKEAVQQHIERMQRMKADADSVEGGGAGIVIYSSVILRWARDRYRSAIGR